MLLEFTVVFFVHSVVVRPAVHYDVNLICAQICVNKASCKRVVVAVGVKSHSFRTMRPWLHEHQFCPYIFISPPALHQTQAIRSHVLLLLYVEDMVWMGI